MRRREFLKTLAGTGLALPGLMTGAACAPKTVKSDPDTGLFLGYVTGDVTAESALVWVRADAGSRVALQFTPRPGFAQPESTRTMFVDSAADNATVIALDHLRPATRYFYRAQVAGKQAGPLAHFVTAPRSDDDAKVVFCFSADTRESYQPFTVMEAIHARRPDFFLHLGDTIYADRGGNARRLEEFWRKYQANRSDPCSRKLFASTSVYALWDDHEVADDYLPGHPLASVGHRAFLDYWPIRRPESEPGRIYRSARWGRGVELFLLDTRQYRDPKRATMLGRSQREWLLHGIGNSTATFKLIATTVPMAGGGRDRWDGYPQERAEIVRFIKEKKISGVVFLSADLHCASITKIPKGNGLIDIGAGPLAAPLNRITNSAHRRYEFFLAENFNFVQMTVDPKVDPNKMLVEFIDQDNRVFHSREING